VDSPLTEEALKAIHDLPNFRRLSVVIEKDALSPPRPFPDLTDLVIKCARDGNWLQVSHAELLLESWRLSRFTLEIRTNWRLPPSIRKGCTRRIHPEHALRVLLPHITLVEPKLPLSPSVHAAYQPRHRIFLPRWLFLDCG